MYFSSTEAVVEFLKTSQTKSDVETQRLEILKQSK